MNRPDAALHGQVKRSAAEIYEAFFVPALFDQWPGRALDAAGLSVEMTSSMSAAAQASWPAPRRSLDGSGSVTGIDINDGMLTIARRTAEAVTWRHGPADHLPFPDQSFDRVVSQFALMFFADQSTSLTEMARVARPGGTITIATWASIDQSPATPPWPTSCNASSATKPPRR
ncbi:MAG: class I SAM-dependent methyltransferase [Microthrixaceae bacterium]